MSALLDQELNTLFSCVATTFGDEIGQAINEKLDAVLALEGIDTANLTAQIAALNALLDANTTGDATNAQTVLAALAALDTRLDTLEGSTAVADLQAALATAQAALATETAARLAEDAAQLLLIQELQQRADSLQSSIVSIQTELGQTGGTGACDCVALTNSIAELSTAVTNLQASDAAQATQIAALQTAIEGLTSQAAAIAAAQAAADAAAATAQAALAAAATAQAAANAAGTAAAAAQSTADGAAAAATANAADIEAVKAAIRGVNCVVVGGTFRTALRTRMGLALGQSNGTGNNG